VADVVIEVELRVVHPHGPSLSEGDESELLPKPGHEMEARLDVVPKLLLARRWSLEDRR
jgi:hypothetical protein